MRELTIAAPGMTLSEIQATLAQRGIVAGSLTTIWSTLRRPELSHQKTPGRPSRVGRMWPSAASFGVCGSAAWTLRHSCSWMVGSKRHRFERRDRQCVDQHGPALRLGAQRRALDRRNTARTLAHDHLRAGLRSTGIIAPLVLDGLITGEAFQAYVAQFVAPSLAPGNVVVMGNLAAHTVRGIREAIATAGANILYLPPYLPI